MSPRLRAAWLSGRTRPLEYRLAQLEALGRFLEEQKKDILEALALDMRKPPFEAEFSEVLLCKNELNESLNNLSRWMKDEQVDKNLATQLDVAFIRRDPYGVVLVIAPCNYPIYLLLVPLIGAIAAGNCVIVKPSEITKNSERLAVEALPRYLDKVRSSPHGWLLPTPCTHWAHPTSDSSRRCSAAFDLARSASAMYWGPYGLGS
uniref:Aldehyde dehydrogenase domain-containing protein n=1 Tax=Anser brachyrhynchus TaxID=132585 RepID=A0A8B9CAF5_9AVES